MMHKKRKNTFILKSLYPYRYWVSLQIFNVIFWSLLRLVSLEVRRRIVNNLDKIVSPTADHYNLVRLLVFVVLISLGWLFAFRLHDLIWRRVKPSLKRDLTNKMMRHAMRHSHRFYQQNLTGELGNKIREVSHKIPASLELIIDAGLFTFLILVGIVVQTTRLAPIFALILGGWIIFSLVSICVVYPHLQGLNKQVAKQNNTIIGHIVDVLSNLMSVRLFTRYRQEEKILNSKAGEAMQKEKRLDWLLLCFYFVQGITFVLAQGASLWVMMKHFKQGRANPGDFIFIIDIGILSVATLFPFMETLKNIFDNWGYIQEGLQVILSPIEIEDKPDATPLVVSKGSIAYEKVFFRHGKEKPLFNDFSLEIGAKEHVALVGYSGSGKTTCINLLLRLFNVDKGHITIDGQNIANVTQASLHQAISVVTQDPYLFQRSVMENIRYSNPSASDEDVIKAAKSAYAHDFICKLPQGYDTLVGERGASISGGQKQRIAIARAFLKHAPILIMDEATSQLDPNTDLLIQQGLEKLRQIRKQTALIITHRMSTLQHVDRILIFSQGKLIGAGAHEELLASNKAYQAFWMNCTKPQKSLT